MSGHDPAGAVWDLVLEKLWRQSRFTSFFYQFTDFLPEPGLPTLGLWVAGKRFCLLYNPAFVLETPPEHLLGLLVHEMLHVLLDHAHRSRPGEDAYLRNLAQDMVVNTYLNLNEKTFFSRRGFQDIPLLSLPPGLPQVPEAFGRETGRRGLTDVAWEDVYAWLKNSRKEAGKTGPDAQGMELPGFLEESPDASPQNPLKDRECPRLTLPGMGFLDPSGRALPTGVHLFGSAEKNEDRKAGKKRVLRFIEGSAQCGGERIYSEVSALLREPPAAMVSWRARIVSLAECFSQSTRWELSRARPNRRFWGEGIIVPGRVHRRHPIVTVAVDLSGSMTASPRSLEAAFGVVEELARSFRINLLCLDQALFIPRKKEGALIPSKARRPYFYRKGDWRLLKSGSGGATFFAPLFNGYMKGRREALIVITDGFIYDLAGLAPYQRTIWVIPEERRGLFRPPFGRLVVMEEA